MLRGSLLLLLLAACSNASSASPHTIPVVFAASSLNECLGEIAREFERRGGERLTMRFDASSTLARQIEQGAYADLFVSAAPEWIDRVKATERLDWLSNRLVLVVPREGADVALNALPSLALANDQVPIGAYAKAALHKVGVQLPERLVYGANARDVVSKVAHGAAAAGIVYATDAMAEPSVRSVYTFPLETHPPIRYTAALLTTEGAGFYASLRQPWALAIAKKHGFEVLIPEAR